MHYVYVLKSLKDGEVYIGLTNDLRRRMLEHASGKVFSTKLRLPMRLVYYEAYNAVIDAVNREKRLKNYGRALAQLRRRIENSLNVSFQ